MESMLSQVPLKQQRDVPNTEVTYGHGHFSKVPLLTQIVKLVIPSWFTEKKNVFHSK